MGGGLDQKGGQQRTRHNVEVLDIFLFLLWSFFVVKKALVSKSANLDDLTVVTG